MENKLNFDFNEDFINGLIKKLHADGYATEGDFVQLYSVQYDGAMDLLNRLLSNAGYDGEVSSIGKFYQCAGAIYGVIDLKTGNYDDAYQELEDEGKRQAQEI